MHLIRLELATVVDCIKGVSKGLFAGRAEVTLTPLASFSLLVGLIMVAEHSFRKRG
jgi:hypothetical protein